MFDLSSQVLYPLQSFDLGMHFDLSAQANWSAGQERESEVFKELLSVVTSWSWATPSWMLRMLVVKRNCNGAKFAIFVKNHKKVALDKSYKLGRRESL